MGSELPKSEDAIPVRQQRFVGLALAGLGVAALKPLAAAATAAGVAPLILATLPGKTGNTGTSNGIVVVDGSFPRTPGFINPLPGSAIQTPVSGFSGPFITGRQNTANAASVVQPTVDRGDTSFYVPTYYYYPLPYAYANPTYAYYPDFSQGFVDDKF